LIGVGTGGASYFVLRPILKSKVITLFASAVAAGAVSMLCFGMSWNNLGYGAASTTAVQAINTGTSIILKKSLAELMN